MNEQEESWANRLIDPVAMVAMVAHLICERWATDQRDCWLVCEVFVELREQANCILLFATLLSMWTVVVRRPLWLSFLSEPQLLLYVALIVQCWLPYFGPGIQIECWSWQSVIGHHNWWLHSGRNNSLLKHPWSERRAMPQVYSDNLHWRIVWAFQSTYVSGKKVCWVADMCLTVGNVCPNSMQLRPAKKAPCYS